MKDLLPLFTISLKAHHQDRDENKEPNSIFPDHFPHSVLFMQTGQRCLMYNGVSHSNHID